MTKKYAYPARLIHWIMAFLFIFMWASGYVMTLDTIDDSPLEETLFFLHISSGVTLVFLMILRIAIRLTHKPPHFVGHMPKLEQIGAHLAHIGLYLLPLATLTIGWAEVDVGGHGVQWFGIPMPKIFPTMEFYGSINLEELTENLHMWLAWATFGLFILHIAAVIKHQYGDKIDILSRMSLKR